MNKKILIVLLVLLCVFYKIDKVYAGRGCCSHHGGQSYCSNDGRWVCNDGTYSPSCRCSESYNGSSNSQQTHENYYKTTTTKLIYGCTDSKALNYNNNANISDRSCKYEKIITDIETMYYNESEDIPNKIKKVVINGENGKKEVQRKIITDESGEEIENTIISENIIKEPINEIARYENKTVAKSLNNNSKLKKTNNSKVIIIITTLILIINIIYSNKYNNANIIINKIRLQNNIFGFILFILYFSFIVPVYIDLIIIILNKVNN